VASATGSSDDDGSHYATNAERDSDEITQEEKPRSRILAEYLAHGYVVGNAGIVSLTFSEQNSPKQNVSGVIYSQDMQALSRQIMHVLIVHDS